MHRSPPLPIAFRFSPTDPIMTETTSLEQSLEDLHLQAKQKKDEKICKTCGKQHLWSVKSCTLSPSPLLEYAGNLPEIWMNIIAQADARTLRDLVRVNKAWFREAVRHRWHSPAADALRFKRMPKKGFKGPEPDGIDFYARLVRHLRYTHDTDKNNQSKGYIRLKKNKAIPELPNLRSVEFLSWSLGERSVEQLERIFRPSLRHVVVKDFVEQGHYGERIRRPNGVHWFDVMTERCPLLESIILGEGLGISPSQFHNFVCRMTHLRAINLERDNEHLLIEHIGTILKRAKIGPDWMMEANAWNTLSQMHALEYLDIAVNDALITSDKLLQLEGLARLKHLHIWPANGPGATRCDVTAVRLILFIKALPKLMGFRLWIEFDFFRHERVVEAAFDLPGGYPQFDDSASRESYLENLGKIAQVESRAESNATEGD
ncbi:hypothetical protein D6C86_08692 [Aureobasidium pullulans]|nr:hypothetical protein D6C86_08692 [Aureobasidium pullulans]THZ92601.1 hypothetical protein D6C88_03097 [Aureobasidium pullulans]